MENMEIKKIYSLHIYRTEKHKWTTKAPRRGCYFTFQKSGSYKHILKDNVGLSIMCYKNQKTSPKDKKEYK